MLVFLEPGIRKFTAYNVGYEYVDAAEPVTDKLKATCLEAKVHRARSGALVVLPEPPKYVK